MFEVLGDLSLKLWEKHIITWGNCKGVHTSDQGSFWGTRRGMGEDERGEKVITLQ